MNDTQEKVIFYNIADIPDNCIAGEEMDLAIQWETVIEEGEFPEETAIRNLEVNELLEKKIRYILKEKSSCCVRIKKEDISHSIHYGHRSHIVRADYQFVLYTKT